MATIVEPFCSWRISYITSATMTLISNDGNTPKRELESDPVPKKPVWSPPPKAPRERRPFR